MERTEPYHFQWPHSNNIQEGDRSTIQHEAVDWHFGNIHFNRKLRVPIHLNLNFLGWDIKFFEIFNIFIRLKSIIWWTITYDAILNQENMDNLVPNDSNHLLVTRLKWSQCPYTYHSLISKILRPWIPEYKLWCFLVRKKWKTKGSQENFWFLENCGTLPRDTLERVWVKITCSKSLWTYCLPMWVIFCLWISSYFVPFSKNKREYRCHSG